MADAGIRDLQRRWEQAPSVAHEAEYLRALLRAGELTQEALELATFAGHPAAGLLVAPVHDPSNMRGWVTGLERFGLPAVQHATASVLRAASHRCPREVQDLASEVLDQAERLGAAFGSDDFRSRIEGLGSLDSRPIRALYHGNLALGGAVAPGAETRAVNQLFNCFDCAQDLCPPEHLDAHLRRGLVGWALGRPEVDRAAPRPPRFFDADHQDTVPDGLALAAIVGDPEASQALARWPLVRVVDVFEQEDEVDAAFFLSDWIYPHAGIEGLLRLGCALCASLAPSLGGEARELLARTEDFVAHGGSFAFRGLIPDDLAPVERSVRRLAQAANHVASCDAGETCHRLFTTSVMGELCWDLRERARAPLQLAARRDLLPWLRGEGDPLAARVESFRAQRGPDLA